MNYMEYVEFLMDAYGMSEYDASRAADLEFFPNDNPEHDFSGSLSASGTLCGGGFEDA